MKKTAIAPSNLAIIKYWGRNNEKERIPANSSLSFNLSGLTTKTTVRFSPDYDKYEVRINGQPARLRDEERVGQHLDYIQQKYKKRKLYARVESVNSFPKDSGLSSSASAFAALTIAAINALELNLREKELSIAARHASGSAARSIPDGFTFWQKGNGSKDDSFAFSIFPQDYFGVSAAACVLSLGNKSVPTTQAQKGAKTSSFFKTRTVSAENKISKTIRAIKERDFTVFGKIMEEETLEMHAVIMTQKPYYLYLYPQTLRAMHEVVKVRNGGFEIYFSVNTGHNIHFVVKREDEDRLKKFVKGLPGIKSYIMSRPCGGAKSVADHLF